MSVLHLFFGVCTTVMCLLGVLWVPCVICAQVGLGLPGGVLSLAIRFGFLLVGVSCLLNVACASVAALLFLVGVGFLMFRSLVAWVVFAS